MNSIVKLGDCMDFMREMPDKAYNLAIVDPPYGIGKHAAIGNGDKRNGNKINKIWMGGKWDCAPPPPEYFGELFRVSKNQIIWGGNYFNDLLPRGNKWLIWDKMQRVNQSDCELAWTSFGGALRIFQNHSSNLQGFRNPNRFHPTEKPVALYTWLLKNYAKEGDKILDTHLGSGSSRIAAYKAGFDFTGFELDKDYFEAQEKRFKTFTDQTTLL